MLLNIKRSSDVEHIAVDGKLRRKLWRGAADRGELTIPQFHRGMGDDFNIAQSKVKCVIPVMAAVEKVQFDHRITGRTFDIGSEVSHAAAIPAGGTDVSTGSALGYPGIETADHLPGSIAGFDIKNVTGINLPGGEVEAGRPH